MTIQKWKLNKFFFVFSTVYCILVVPICPSLYTTHAYLPISVVDSNTNHSVLDIKVNRVKEAFRILLLVCVCGCK